MVSAPAESIEAARAALQSLVPASYYYWSEDLSTIYYNEDDPSLVDCYDDVYVVDGYEAGGQYFETMTYADFYTEGYYAFIIYIGGEPAKIEWTAESAILEFFSVYQIPWQPTDYSSEFGIPAFGTGIIFGAYTEELVEGVQSDVELIMSRFIKGFEVIEDWKEETLTDGTPALTCSYGWAGEDVLVEFIYTMYESEGDLILEVMTIEIPSNPDTLA